MVPNATVLATATAISRFGALTAGASAVMAVTPQWTCAAVNSRHLRSPAFPAAISNSMPAPIEAIDGKFLTSPSRSSRKLSLPRHNAGLNGFTENVIPL
jgi:hypothetical protein